ncbi:MAG: hypothetical protein ACLT4C_02545 [Butyricicoccus sp.]
MTDLLDGEFPATSRKTVGNDGILQIIFTHADAHALRNAPDTQVVYTFDVR